MPPLTSVTLRQLGGMSESLVLYKRARSELISAIVTLLNRSVSCWGL